jgi:hypothetical protein
LVVWRFWKLWEEKPEELMLNGTSGHPRDLLATSNKDFLFF